MKISGTILYFD